ncbi:amidohydrolase family protein [Dactylosporangium aurantiacum]|uniref:Amidohydrolase family protein n=1 Tax=Dactylosporangium aurantiacum TaxID=35754 RepID=A0A9Q9IQM2_9ACTN|nr:amidohydrolase family protein [Dactylosporangium aurantiacum]MDG6105750.1 amidohydrolase family protein [Dactylosporangium aurantiacum]UWZ58057.1 amidohydrolase family protein [Dactylosporangium aurantiacum]
MSDRAPAQWDIVDAHHHLWVRAEHPQPWINAATMTAINADFTVDDLAPLAKSAGVTRTVVVQSISSEAETADLLRLAGTSDLIGGVVGWVDLMAGDVAERVARLRAGPGGDRLAGIRHLVQGESDPAFLDRPDLRRGVAAVGAAGLVFDLVIRRHQLPAAARLARDLPEVRFVLDHLGKPSTPCSRDGGWARDLRTFARLPNTTAKLSGLATEADWSTWTPQDLRPAVDHAIEVFGPSRLMFGSDWPVCLLATSYQRWIDVLGELLDPLGEADQAMIWHRTARRVYRLPRA